MFLLEPKQFKLFANRIAIHKDNLGVKKKIITRKTKFSFFVDNGYMPSVLLSSFNLKKNLPSLSLNTDPNLCLVVDGVSNLIILNK